MIRIATLDDAQALLDIYAPYVRDTAITFECEVPALEDFRRRIAATLERYPYLVAEVDGQVGGYAYAGVFKGRAAYDWAVETSIYVRRDGLRRGLGRQLYGALERALGLQGVLNACACIAAPRTDDDPYLTDGSIRFHERLGYAPVGRFDLCACKFGRWYDMVWMQKLIGAHPGDPDPIKPFPRVADEFARLLFQLQ